MNILQQIHNCQTAEDLDRAEKEIHRLARMGKIRFPVAKRAYMRKRAELEGTS